MDDNFNIEKYISDNVDKTIEENQKAIDISENGLPVNEYSEPGFGEAFFAGVKNPSATNMAKNIINFGSDVALSAGANYISLFASIAKHFTNDRFSKEAYNELQDVGKMIDSGRKLLAKKNLYDIEGTSNLKTIVADFAGGMFFYGPMIGAQANAFGKLYKASRLGNTKLAVQWANKVAKFSPKGKKAYDVIRDVFINTVDGGAIDAVRTSDEEDVVENVISGMEMGGGFYVAMKAGSAILQRLLKLSPKLAEKFLIKMKRDIETGKTKPKDIEKLLKDVEINSKVEEKLNESENPPNDLAKKFASDEEIKAVQDFNEQNWKRPNAYSSLKKENGKTEDLQNIETIIPEDVLKTINESIEDNFGKSDDGSTPQKKETKTTKTPKVSNEKAVKVIDWLSKHSEKFKKKIENNENFIKEEIKKISEDPKLLKKYQKYANKIYNENKEGFAKTSEENTKTDISVPNKELISKLRKVDKAFETKYPQDSVEYKKMLNTLKKSPKIKKAVVEHYNKMVENGQKKLKVENKEKIKSEPKPKYESTFIREPIPASETTQKKLDYAAFVINRFDKDKINKKKLAEIKGDENLARETIARAIGVSTKAKLEITKKVQDLFLFDPKIQKLIKKGGYKKTVDAILFDKPKHTNFLRYYKKTMLKKPRTVIPKPTNYGESKKVKKETTRTVKRIDPNATKSKPEFDNPLLPYSHGESGVAGYAKTASISESKLDEAIKTNDVFRYWSSEDNNIGNSELSIDDIGKSSGKVEDNFDFLDVENNDHPLLNFKEKSAEDVFFEKNDKELTYNDFNEKFTKNSKNAVKEIIKNSDKKITKVNARKMFLKDLQKQGFLSSEDTKGLVKHIRKEIFDLEVSKKIYENKIDKSDEFAKTFEEAVGYESNFTGVNNEIKARKFSEGLQELAYRKRLSIKQLRREMYKNGVIDKNTSSKITSELSGLKKKFGNTTDIMMADSIAKHITRKFEERFDKMSTPGKALMVRYKRLVPVFNYITQTKKTMEAIATGKKSKYYTANELKFFNKALETKREMDSLFKNKFSNIMLELNKVKMINTKLDAIEKKVRRYFAITNAERKYFSGKDTSKAKNEIIRDIGEALEKGYITEDEYDNFLYKTIKENVSVDETRRIKSKLLTLKKIYEDLLKNKAFKFEKKNSKEPPKVDAPKSETKKAEISPKKEKGKPHIAIAKKLGISKGETRKMEKLYKNSTVQTIIYNLEKELKTTIAKVGSSDGFTGYFETQSNQANLTSIFDKTPNSKLLETLIHEGLGHALVYFSKTKEGNKIFGSNGILGDLPENLKAELKNYFTSKYEIPPGLPENIIDWKEEGFVTFLTDWIYNDDNIKTLGANLDEYFTEKFKNSPAIKKLLHRVSILVNNIPEDPTKRVSAITAAREEIVAKTLSQKLFDQSSEAVNMVRKAFINSAIIIDDMAKDLAENIPLEVKELYYKFKRDYTRLRVFPANMLHNAIDGAGLFSKQGYKRSESLSKILGDLSDIERDEFINYLKNKNLQEYYNRKKDKNIIEKVVKKSAEGDPYPEASGKEISDNFWASPEELDVAISKLEKEFGLTKTLLFQNKADEMQQWIKSVYDVLLEEEMIREEDVRKLFVSDFWLPFTRTNDTYKFAPGEPRPDNYNNISLIGDKPSRTIGGGAFRPLDDFFTSIKKNILDVSTRGVAYKVRNDYLNLMESGAIKNSAKYLKKMTTPYVVKSLKASSIINGLLRNGSLDPIAKTLGINPSKLAGQLLENIKDIEVNRIAGDINRNLKEFGNDSFTPEKYANEISEVLNSIIIKEVDPNVFSSPNILVKTVTSEETGPNVMVYEVPQEAATIFTSLHINSPVQSKVGKIAASLVKMAKNVVLAMNPAVLFNIGLENLFEGAFHDRFYKSTLKEYKKSVSYPGVNYVKGLLQLIGNKSIQVHDGEKFVSLNLNDTFNANSGIRLQNEMKQTLENLFSPTEYKFGIKHLNKTKEYVSSAFDKLGHILTDPIPFYYFTKAIKEMSDANLKAGKEMFSLEEMISIGTDKALHSGPIYGNIGFATSKIAPYTLFLNSGIQAVFQKYQGVSNWIKSVKAGEKTPENILKDLGYLTMISGSGAIVMLHKILEYYDEYEEKRYDDNSGKFHFNIGAIKKLVAKLTGVSILETIDDNYTVVLPMVSRDVGSLLMKAVDGDLISSLSPENAGNMVLQSLRWFSGPFGAMLINAITNKDYNGNDIVNDHAKLANVINQVTRKSLDNRNWGSVFIRKVVDAFNNVSPLKVAPVSVANNVKSFLPVNLANQIGNLTDSLIKGKIIKTKDVPILSRFLKEEENVNKNNVMNVFKEYNKLQEEKRGLGIRRAGSKRGSEEWKKANKEYQKTKSQLKKFNPGNKGSVINRLMKVLKAYYKAMDNGEKRKAKKYSDIINKITEKTMKNLRRR